MKKVGSVAKAIVKRFRHPRIDDQGREIVSPVSMEPPVRYSRQPTMESRIRDAIRSEMFNEAARKGGFETPEEADDFDVPDDPIDPSTPYEAYFDPLPIREKSESVPPAVPAGGEPADSAGVQADVAAEQQPAK